MVSPDSIENRKRKSWSAWISVPILVAFLLLVGWFLRESSPLGSTVQKRANPVGIVGSRGPYIGSRICAECHPGESAFFAHSGHANTLRVASRRSLAQKLDGRVVNDPEKPGVTWAYSLKEDRLQVERKEIENIQRFIIEYAFGSGHHATTFVTLTDPSIPTAMEHRLTYFKEKDSLAITPGQRTENPSEGTTAVGRTLNSTVTLKCFRCHTTRISAATDQRLDVEDLIPNVSCERCHGPARAHVADARAGRVDLTMPFSPESWTAESQLALCGQCHRHPSRATPGLIHPDNTALARFQPVGISQSKCYLNSDGKLSCVTCHDPHRRASSDHAGYEIACLDCHGTKSKTSCSVSPQSGCINCHMPKVDSGQRVLFTDHWIRIRPSTPTPSAR